MRGELTLREEGADDAAAIGLVLEAAFGGSLEVALVEELRTNRQLELSLVAERSGKLVGHVALSAVTTPDCETSVRGLGLAPLAVTPREQRRGIGGALVRRALELARADGAAFVVLLGSPAYYARFGFLPASSAGLRCVYDAPAEAFQVLELSPGALRGVHGRVLYASAFSRFE